MKQWVVLAFLIGCGGGASKTKQDLEAEYGPKLKPKLEAIIDAAKLADTARFEPLGSPGGPPTDVDVDYNDDAHTGNTVIAQSDDLASATTDASQSFRFAELDNDEVRIAKAFVGAGVPLSTGNWVTYTDELQHVIDAKYLLVVYATKLSSPSAGIGRTEFTPGTAKATVILVEIAGKKAHGGFEVTATNSDKILVKSREVGAADDKAQADLQAQLGKAIADGIRKRWRNAKAPWNWGHGW